jgi:hypothetical protein
MVTVLLIVSIAVIVKLPAKAPVERLPAATNKPVIIQVVESQTTKILWPIGGRVVSAQ